jgi:site-specific recombinase XerD
LLDDARMSSGLSSFEFSAIRSEQAILCVAAGQQTARFDPSTLFLTSWGEEFSPHRLTQLVRDHVVAAETGKKGACHLFRHTMATLMLDARVWR